MNKVTETFIAAKNIVAFSALSITAQGTVEHLEWPLIQKCAKFIGISLSDALEGTPVEVCLVGIVENPAWNFKPQTNIYSYYNGLLSIDPPTENILRIGMAVAPTKIFVKPLEFLALNP